jgi:FKBP-type peptidyl-prolyl cis-trans isomerase
MSLKHLRLIMIATAVLLIGSACKQSQTLSGPEVSLTQEPPEAIAPLDAGTPVVEATAGPTTEPNPTALVQYTTTESGLKYWIIQQGDGPIPEPGDSVTVKYRGTLEDGTEFDSGEYTFVLGMGMVIPGWDEGIGLLNEGTTAELVIPPDLAYGAEGIDGVIPPNATLIFEVELLSVEPGQ